MLKASPHSFRSGFTMVELLVAMAILAIMVAALGTIMGTASNITTTNDNHIETNGRARTVFDRMANDFAQMVKRNDVDFIFCKATGNDTMFFYTEGASYYDGATPAGPDLKNRVSLVGYRVNNLNTASSYGQMERLGKALTWDAGAATLPAMVLLNYPMPETGGSYSAAFTPSTLAGAYATLGSSGGSVVGTPPPSGTFNDSTDTNYHPLASNVFRFEYSFQLKDGTQSDIPVMQKFTATNPNGVPSNTSASIPPTNANDFSEGYAPGSRWYDSNNQIGYICIDASPGNPGNAVWHEIGIQDVSAVVVTIAVMDDQTMVFVKNAGINLATVATAFADLPDGDAAPAADIVNTWTTAITPPLGNKSTVSAATGIPQSMVSQIRIYQRFFYINNT